MALKTRKDALERFWEKVDKDGPVPAEYPALGNCWIWTRFTHDGYGVFWFLGRNRPAHRWLYEHLHGLIPDGYEPDHRCRNRACVRPDHLEIVTQAENVRRGAIYRRGIAYGVAAINTAKTHCPRNHPYDEANTRHYAGRRHCRVCRREDWNARKAAA